MSEKILLLILLLLNIFIALFLYKKLKSVLYHISHKHQIHQEEFIKYIAAIEKRISRPFKDFHNLEGDAYPWTVVTSYNRKENLKNTILSIRTHEPKTKILVIDNGSDIETINLIYYLKKESFIDKVLLNMKEDIPQWQKSFSMAQAMKLLSMEHIQGGITWIDDDMIVKKPWIHISESIITNFSKEKIKIVTCHNDQLQEKFHPTEQIIPFKGYLIHLKSSFNGSFFYTPLSFLETVGMPPFSEGYSAASTEDWYYSRQLAKNKWKVATLDCSDHIGYDQSHRENL